MRWRVKHPVLKIPIYSENISFERGGGKVEPKSIVKLDFDGSVRSA